MLPFLTDLMFKTILNFSKLVKLKYFNMNE
jgi:hypothetical protein